jgi:peptidoglycan/LPS O-acetylase OafA/YrhL
MRRAVDAYSKYEEGKQVNRVALFIARYPIDRWPAWFFIVAEVVGGLAAVGIAASAVASGSWWGRAVNGVVAVATLVALGGAMFYRRNPPELDSKRRK